MSGNSILAFHSTKFPPDGACSCQCAVYNSLMCDMLYAAMFNGFLYLTSMPFSDCGKFSIVQHGDFGLSCN